MNTLFPMKYRRFGRTELSMPVFSCGGMRYQHKWDDCKPEEIPEENQRNLEATVLRSLELGISHIETARGYGTSEMQLGWLLPKLPREKMIVQTKVAPCADPKEFLATFERSLGYLKLGHVDLLSFHGINTPELLDWTLRKGGCLDVARQLQREGRCRFVGFSTHATTGVIENAIRTGEFDYVNLHWYFVNPYNWQAVRAAAAEDMGVFIISPTDKGGMLHEPPDKLRRLCEPLSPIEFNNLYCLSKPEVHTLSVGAARPSDFDAHVASLAHYEHAATTVAPVVARLNAELEGVLGPEWCAHALQGVPDFDRIPGEVNVQEILRLWTYAKGLDLTAWGKMRYNLMGNAGHWFPGSNAASADGAAISQALQGHRLAGQIPEILRQAHALLFETPKKRLSEGG